MKCLNLYSLNKNVLSLCYDRNRGFSKTTSCLHRVCCRVGKIKRHKVYFEVGMNALKIMKAEAGGFYFRCALMEGLSGWWKVFLKRCLSRD